MSETAWIKRYIMPLVSAEGADGLRDDVAILSTPGTMIVNVDMLIEGIHFLEADPIDTVGQKLVRVNVSDILAKGALPHEALLSIAWPRGWVEADFADLIAGLDRDFKTYGIALIGGDTVGTEGPLSLSLTLTGVCIGAGPVRRGSGRPGQALHVSGAIGWGHVGLEAALAERDPSAAQKYRVPMTGDAKTAHLVAEFATASMDISDGLLIDASNLAATSACGLEIDLDLVPFAVPSDDLEALLDQCTGGDDYQVLMAVPDGTVVPGFTRIGRLTDELGLRLFHKGRDVNPPVTLGFEH